VTPPAAPLQGRVALVTGASRGLGKQIALELGRRGAAVAVLARSEQPGRVPGTIHDTAAAITDAGGAALAVRCDLTDDDQIASAVAQAVDGLGPIDLLVNNAGLILTKPLLETAPRHLDLLYRVNVRAPFLLMQTVVPGMIEAGCGHIVNIATLSSQARGTAVPLGYAGYTGTKAALARMTLAIALELGPHGISVNALAPTGLIETEGWRTVAGDARLPNAEPIEYVGQAVAWIATQDPRTLTGRFLETQALLESAGLIDHADYTYADLPQVDASAIGQA
jgi:NAD(P)-dependent dehydrogenase (short-subunit alcohol dehydrogenase family)